MMTSTTIKRLSEMNTRLKQTIFWFPAPAFISIGLAMILTGQIIIHLNPRLGSLAELHEGVGGEELEGSILIMVSVLGEDVIVTTPDKRVYRWSAEEPESGDFKDFKAYLQTRSKELLTEFSVERRATPTRTSIVISADRRSTWYHIHPLIAAFAEAGFDSYGFETKKLKDHSF